MSELTDVAKKAFAEKFDKKTEKLLKDALNNFGKASFGNYSNKELYNYMDKANESIANLHNHLDTMLPGIKSHLDNLQSNEDTDVHLGNIDDTIYKIGQKLQHFTPEMKQDVLKEMKMGTSHGYSEYAPFFKHITSRRSILNDNFFFHTDKVFQDHAKALASLPSHMHKTYVDMLPEWSQSPKDLANFVRMAHGE